MVVRISDKTQNYSKVTKLLVKPKNFIFYQINASVFEEMLCYFKSFIGGNEDVEK